MNGKQRILATVRGEAIDHRVFMPISMSIAADEVGAKYRDYATDFRFLARGQLAFAAAFGADLVSVISDPAVEAADLGAAIIAPEDQPASLDDTRSVLADKAALSGLGLPGGAASSSFSV